MAEVSSHGPLIRAEFSLFEELSSRVVGWELDFCQFSQATAPFFIEQLTGPATMISRAVLPARFHQQGVVAPGYRTFSLLASGAGPSSWRWCGESISSNSLLVMPVDGEFESMSSEGLDSLHLTLPISLLDDVAQRHFSEPLHHLLPDERAFCANVGAPLFRLRRLLQQYAPGPGYSQQRQSQLSLPSLTPMVEREMACLVLACLHTGHQREPMFPSGKRWRVLERALREMSVVDAGAMSVARLVAATDASRRTLENAFRDGLGISPATYIKALKLQRLNRALLGGDVNLIGVAELAQRHGFRHLGQLAADYRQAFGELPSATLQRRSPGNQGARSSREAC